MIAHTPHSADSDAPQDHATCDACAHPRTPRFGIPQGMSANNDEIIRSAPKSASVAEN